MHHGITIQTTKLTFSGTLKTHTKLLVVIQLRIGTSDTTDDISWNDTV